MLLNLDYAIYMQYTLSLIELSCFIVIKLDLSQS